MSLQVTTGDTRERLMPRLLLDQMDAVIGYGLPTAEDKPIYRDPDLPGVSFRSLRRTVKMVLIYHPQSPPKFFSSREPSPGNPINPRSINLRETTFISVASWRQTEAIQDLMDQADRFGRLHTVRTYDEALAIVRMGSGFAFVPEMLIGRRIVTTCPLTPESAFQRELGVYYRNSPIDDSPQSPVVRAGACQFLEFFSHYLGDPLCDLRTPPAFNSDIRGELGGRSYDPADTPEKKYWNIVLSFQQKWRGMNNADWEDFSLKQYPPDDKSDRFEYTPPPLSE
jgi:DNA-binding transcriptional LysR family regulator